MDIDIDMDMDMDMVGSGGCARRCVCTVLALLPVDLGAERSGAETSAVRRQNGDEEQRKAVALPSFITPKLVRYVCYRYGRLCKPCTFASLVRYSVGAAAKFSFR